MTQAHKASRLLIQDAIYAVPFEAAHFNYNEDVIGIQYGDTVLPTGSAIYTMSNISKFGGGVAIEEATTNLVATGSANTMFTYGTGTFTQAVVDGGYFDGWNKTTLTAINSTNSLLCGTNGVGIASGNINPYAFSIDLYCPKGNIVPRIEGTANYGDCVLVGGNRWVNVKTGTTPTVHNQSFYFRATDSNVLVGDVFYWRNKQVETKPFATSYVSSTTTRATGVLAYPDTLISEIEGTISFWYIPTIPWEDGTMTNGTSETTIENFFVWGTPGQANCLWSRRTRGSKTLSFIYNLVGCNWTYTGVLTGLMPAMITFTYKAGEQKLFVNGVLRASTTTAVQARPTTGICNVGIRSGLATASGTIDDLIIDRTARTDEEVISWYISGEVFYNPYDYRGYAY